MAIFILLKTYKFRPPPIFLLVNAVASFQPSSPGLPNADNDLRKMKYESPEPKSVPNVPRKKAFSNPSVSLNILAISALSKRSGVASFTTVDCKFLICIDPADGSTPQLVRIAVINIEQTGPLNIFPTLVTSNFSPDDAENAITVHSAHI